MILQKNQQGFTLIELMVAMVIFAVLALAGWQIMDGLTKSRERAKIQSERLANLQYAYLQLSQDFAHTTNYVIMPTNLTSQNQQNSDNQNNNQQKMVIDSSQLIPTFQLTEQEINFIRFASPDPRYQPSPMLAKIRYLSQDNQLVKQRFYQLEQGNETPNSSVLLDNVNNIKWTAFTPDTVQQFPNQNSQNLMSFNQTENIKTVDNPFENVQQLPKAVQIEFLYHDEPIVWRFLLPEIAPMPTFQPNTDNQNNTNSQSNSTSPTGSGQP